MKITIVFQDGETKIINSARISRDRNGYFDENGMWHKIKSLPSGTIYYEKRINQYTIEGWCFHTKKFSWSENDGEVTIFCGEIDDGPHLEMVDQSTY